MAYDPPKSLVVVCTNSLKLVSAQSHKLPDAVKTLGGVIDLGYEVVSLANLEDNRTMVALRFIG